MFSLTSPQIKFILFCVPVRLLLALLAYRAPTQYLPMLGVPLLIMSMGFLILFFGNLRQKATEADGVTWWANQRLLHGGLYLIASIYAFRKSRDVWMPLIMDALLGIFLGIRKGINAS
jgi:hypothetical protein